MANYHSWDLSWRRTFNSPHFLRMAQLRTFLPTFTPGNFH